MSIKEFKKYYLYITVFITGASILVLEILGTRIIAPYYGTTLYVWSSLITVTLVFLAGGYFVGGKLADKISEFSMLYVFIFLAGISIVLISKFDSFILVGTNSLGPKFGPLVSSFILFPIPMFLLGMVTPYAVKLKAKDLGTIGMTTGNLYAMSTIGSVVGALLTAFYLIPNFTIITTIMLMAFSLFIVSSIWFIVNKKNRGLFLLFALLFIPQHNVKPLEDVKVIYETESFYGHIKVVDRGDMRYLLVDDSVQSGIDKKFRGDCCFASTEEIVVFWNKPNTALVVGLGGGVLTKRVSTRYGVDTDAVEIDPKMFEIAKKYFGFKDSDGKVIINDARHYIRNTDKKYDAILLDAYTGNQVPSHLFSVEMFQEVDSILTDRGAVMLYMGAHWDSDYVRAVYKTFKKVFPNTRVFSTAFNGSTLVEGYGGISFIGSKKDVEKQVILDNINDMAESDFFKKEFTRVIEHKEMEIKTTEETPIITDNYNPVDLLQIESTLSNKFAAKSAFGDGVAFLR